MDIETAKTHLAAWIEADTMLAEAQSYEIETPNGRRRVTRANLPEVRKQIAYWQGIINRLSGKKRKPYVLGNLQESE